MCHVNNSCSALPGISFRSLWSVDSFDVVYMILCIESRCIYIVSSCRHESCASQSEDDMICKSHASCKPNADLEMKADAINSRSLPDLLSDKSLLITHTCMLEFVCVQFDNRNVLLESKNSTVCICHHIIQHTLLAMVCRITLSRLSSRFSPDSSVK